MSRLQAHRKSHSTSALSVIASSSGNGAPAPKRTSKERPKGLERVPEVEAGSSSEVKASPAAARRLDDPPAVLGIQRRTEDVETGQDEYEVAARISQARGWLNEILSIRTSSSRRLRCLMHLEELVLSCCLPTPLATGNIGLSHLLALNVHTNLLILLTRHAQTLALRANSQSHAALSANEETALALVPELSCLFGLLQGVCLLSRTCKTACGQDWAMEMFIDLLLLLRAIPAESQPAPTDIHATPSAAQAKPIVYSILELFFCILVDSPESARAFERLSGLEAVTRVLKGSTVAKEVRMKCIEFLYFYLEPEHQSRSLSSSSSSSNRSTSSTTTASSTSSSDSLYPPSPLDRTSFSPLRVSPTIASPRSTRLVDLDVQYIPQTPRKKATPNLGYLTPSSRRTSTSGTGHSGKTTPSLETVPASPAATANTASADPATPKASGAKRGASALASGSVSDRSSDRGASGPGDEIGLGLGMSEPNTAAGGLKRDDMTVTRRLDVLLTASPGPMAESERKQRSIQPSSSSSSSSITITPNSGPCSGSGKISRSSTQPNLNMPMPPPPPRAPGSSGPGHRRQVSVSSRRSSHSPLVHSSIPEYAPSPRAAIPDPTQAPTAKLSGGPPRSKIRHSRTSSELSELITTSTPSVPVHVTASPQLPRIRHSATSSRLSIPANSDDSEGRHAPRMRHSRTSSHLSSALASASPTSNSAAAVGDSTVQGSTGTPKGKAHIRHSRTSSHLASVSVANSSSPLHEEGQGMPPPVHSRRPSTSASSSSASESTIAGGLHPTASPAPGVDMERTPSKARRGFPPELTRGSLPPPTSTSTSDTQISCQHEVQSSSKPTPLGHSRRVSSISDHPKSSLPPMPPGPGKAHRERYGRDHGYDHESDRGLKKETTRSEAKGDAARHHRTVQEKKDLLGKYLGNVDALVQGVNDRGGWWGAGR